MRMDSRPSTSTATQMKNQKAPLQSKLFKDPIYDYIEVHRAALLIIDTPQFQRLRHIKQLSTVHYVYPGANGTRFDHSLGVYHLAGKLVRCLKDKQPELGLTEVDCLCVELAGLCHDLGHGPFSHIFDQQILPRLEVNHSHETLSVKMLDYMYSMNNNQLKQELQAWNITEQDWEFIKSLIICEPCERSTGRGENKLFLYDIVSNKESGNDVDKWDYLLRDSHYLGVKHSFDYERVLHYARVITDEGRPHICVRDKMVDTIYQLYSTRYNLHKHAYQHPVALGVALMVEEAIVTASTSLKICGKSIVECLDDMEAYTNLHDGIFYLIRDSNDPRLEEARQLLKRIEERKLYQRVAHATYKKDECQPSTADLEKELENRIPGRKFKLVFRQRDFGKKLENPVKFIKFYAKRELERIQPWKDNSLVFPNDFMDETVSAYCISGVVNSEVFDEAERIFREHGLKVSNLHD